MRSCWARLFGILPAASRPQRRRWDPRSGRTAAGAVLCSDAGATASASSGDASCETERGRLVSERGNSLFTGGFPDATGQGARKIPRRLPFPQKVGPDDLRRSLPAWALLGLLQDVKSRVGARFWDFIVALSIFRFFLTGHCSGGSFPLKTLHFEVKRKLSDLTVGVKGL